MKKDMLLLKVVGIILDSKTKTPEVLLSIEKQQKLLSITICPFEANSIITSLENINTSRLLTYDLFAYFFNKHRFKMQKLEFYDYVKDKYLTRIKYKKGIKSYQINVRASDGLALALKLDTPIFIKRAVLEKSAVKKSIVINDSNDYSNILFIKPASHSFM